jgi:hypothetical protein
VQEIIFVNAECGKGKEYAFDAPDEKTMEMKCNLE